MRHILSNIINPVSPERADYLQDQVISIEGKTIAAITPKTEFRGVITDNYSNSLALPGLIDLHVHLSQYKIRGRFEPALLPWLDKHVFPEESRSADPVYAEELSRLFFNALLKAGTTFSVIYSAPFSESCEMAFQVADELGVKAMIGMTMMDMNSPESLQQDSLKSLKDSISLYEKWHGKRADLDYIFTPRFAPTCTMNLMKRIGEFISEHKAWVQTHLSENHTEIAWVKELFGLPSYAEVYQTAGLLSEHSILGHAIHLSNEELDILAQTKAKIAHCPDSNFFLKSGEFPLFRIESAGIPFGLGSDVGAGTTLDMLYHAKLMNFRQSKEPVSETKALYHITLGSAKILNREKSIGSLEPGKDADIVFYIPPEGFTPCAESLSQLIFFSHEFSLRETLVNGVSRYNN